MQTPLVPFLVNLAEPGYNDIPNHWKKQLVDRGLIEYTAQKLFEFRQ